MPDINKMSQIDLIKLVNDLKNALVQRELRIGQLELQLSKALVSRGEVSVSELEKSLLPPPPPPASHPYSPHLSAETRGLYSDGWVSPAAQLVFHPSSSDGHYLISFWLPEVAAAKQLVLKRTSGETATLELTPNSITLFKLPAPSDGLSPASVSVETTRFIASDDDKRKLGVVLLKVEFVLNEGSSTAEKPHLVLGER